MPVLAIFDIIHKRSNAENGGVIFTVGGGGGGRIVFEQISFQRISSSSLSALGNLSIISTRTNESHLP